jgi:hypothetical protein
MKAPKVNLVMDADSEDAQGSYQVSEEYASFSEIV